MTCPWCGATLGPFDSDPDGQPQTDDVTLCWQCLRWSVFLVSAVGLTLRRANAWESAKIMKRLDCQAAYHALKERRTM